jgi:hypothetical protein
MDLDTRGRCILRYMLRLWVYEVIKSNTKREALKLDRVAFPAEE